MTRNFSPVSNVILIIIHAVGIWAMLSLSYGWSLDQTQDFMSAVVGIDAAAAGAWLIQLAPQMMLVAAAISKLNGNGRMATVLIASALLVNALDAYTNVVTFREWWPTWATYLIEQGRSAEFINATQPVGQAMAFLVTWFEEGVSLALGSMLQLVADHMQAMGQRPPRFFRAGIVAAGGFDFRGVNKEAKRQSNGKQPSRDGQQQPAVAPASVTQTAAQRNHRQQWPQ
jgi:hypothetical protein